MVKRAMAASSGQWVAIDTTAVTVDETVVGPRGIVAEAAAAERADKMAWKVTVTVMVMEVNEKTAGTV